MFDDLIDVAIKLLLVILSFIGGWLVISGAYAAINYAFLGRQSAIGVVKDVVFYPQHVSYEFNAALKMSVPRTIPDEWEMKIVCDGWSGWFVSDEPPRRWFAEGKTVGVRYTSGRIDGVRSITDIYDPNS